MLLHLQDPDNPPHQWNQNQHHPDNPANKRHQRQNQRRHKRQRQRQHKHQRQRQNPQFHLETRPPLNPISGKKPN